MTFGILVHNPGEKFFCQICTLLRVKETGRKSLFLLRNNLWYCLLNCCSIYMINYRNQQCCPFFVATSYCSWLWPTSGQGVACSIPELWPSVLAPSFYSHTKSTAPPVLLLQTDWQDCFFFPPTEEVEAFSDSKRVRITSIQGTYSCIDGSLCCGYMCAVMSPKSRDWQWCCSGHSQLCTEFNWSS